LREEESTQVMGGGSLRNIKKRNKRLGSNDVSIYI
jgi:hypothetical protein